ncbi:MAG: heme-binding protein [Actinomycetota bacterium]|nr:heme-binding protein [Actinomycetota bacterium]
MTQRQEFKVLRSYKDFEVREYLPCVIAEIKVSADYSSAGGLAFSSLFNYISKGNKGAEAIAMTSPVIASKKEDRSQENEWFISFVMPPGRTFGQLPDPNDPRVALRELNSEICIAASFRGRATEELAMRKVTELRASAAKENMSLSVESRICRFDPPFKPGLLHYNEIVIPIHGGQ